MEVIGYTSSGSIQIELDGEILVVPNDPKNRHRQMIAKWEKQGNTIPHLATEAPTQLDYQTAIQNMIDDKAKEKRYDNGNSMATYVTSSDPVWAIEAQAFVEWRDRVWQHAYREMDKVLSGVRAQPTVDEILAELPPLVWPEIEGIET